MPVWNVLVCDTGGNIEHDNTALSIDVVTIAETSELLLSSSIPDIELDWAQVLSSVSKSSASLSYRCLLVGGTYCGEAERVNLDT
jgi:hypothetical protein